MADHLPPPLSGVRVLELAHLIAGPICGMYLADMGADVVKVESREAPDAGRSVYPRAMRNGEGALHMTVNRNKRAICLDVKQPAGRDAFRRLAAWADIIIEGFRGGVAERLGIDYDSVKTANPRLIYCSISGYGQDGPYRDRVGHDINYLGYAGVLNFVGEAGGPPVVPGVQIADIAGGALMAAVGILTAVIARQQTGRGQFVDIAMLDGSMACNAYHTLMWFLSGQLPQRGREQLTGHYPCYAVYETRDGRHVTVGAFEPHFWATLCRHFDHEDFIARQWDETAREEMFAFFREAFRAKTLDEWMRELAAQEICFGPVNTLEETFADPQLRHREMIVEMQTPGGASLLPGTPIKLSETPGSVRTPPPGFGEHTETVLRGLGLPADEIERLRTESVI